MTFDSLFLMIILSKNVTGPFKPDNAWEICHVVKRHMARVFMDYVWVASAFTSFSCTMLKLMHNGRRL